MSDDLSADQEVVAPFIPRWLEECNLKATPYRVICHLWSYGRGRCFPSLETIASRCRLNLKTVKSTTRELESLGLVTRKKRKAAGVRFSNEYLLTGPKEAPVKLQPAQKEPHLTGPIETPPNRPKRSPRNVTSLNVTKMNEDMLLSVSDELPEIIWKNTPPKGRERSSREDLRKAWVKIPPTVRPSHQEVIRALDAWKRSDAWTTDSGKWVPGIHRWVNARKWQDLPEPAKGNFKGFDEEIDIPT
jgi:Helix-turn-helix domain